MNYFWKGEVNVDVEMRPKVADNLDTCILNLQIVQEKIKTIKVS